MQPLAFRNGLHSLGLAWLVSSTVFASDWPQFRGPAMDGTTTDPIATVWNTNNPGFLVWRNLTLTNGFGSFAVSQGRAFTQISRGSPRLEYCVAVDATFGTNLWSRSIDTAPWDPNATGNGGEGRAPCNKGDGPRTTPSVQAGRVYVLSSKNLHLLCLNATNGSVIWSNNLSAAYGASTATWENAASPRLDGGLIFVNLNTSHDGTTLAAFNTTNGSLVWRSQTANATHATPTVATIDGVRQVIFATVSGLISVGRDAGNHLWTYPYPFDPVDTAMGASAVVHSNLVFVTAAYGARGSAVARVTRNSNGWTVTHLWFRTSQSGVTFKSTWMTPVCYQGHVYGLFGDKSWTNSPLNCIELATGQLRWSVPNFGMGGIIAVNTNLLVATEDGQLVLVQPNPNAYAEVARYRAFTFTSAAPGKVWNSPAYSDGRIYLRSTRGAVSLNVSPPLPPSPLKFLAAQPASSSAMRLVIGTSNGTPITPDRFAGIELRSTNRLDAPPALWPKLSLPLFLTAEGLAVGTNPLSTIRTQSFYITVER